jgi:N-acetyl-gamma-glutamyl-phosphate reductase/acetylglutamate kinase
MTTVSSQRGYATAVERGGPILASSTDKKRVALIGARGYTGQSLIALLNNHPLLELSHVSSRELAGLPLKEYTKSQLNYTNLGVEDLKKLERGEGPGAPPDAYVMALPNGVCKPFVEAVQEGGKNKPNGHGTIVDLSADHRFNPDWTYGLPGQ